MVSVRMSLSSGSPGWLDGLGSDASSTLRSDSWGPLRLHLVESSGLALEFHLTEDQPDASSEDLSPA